MSRRVFCLPDLAEGLEDAEVTGWRVAEGERVALNQVLGEVQTSKAAVEIPSPHAGVVVTLHAGPGELVRVGAPLVTFEVAGDDPPPGPGIVGRMPGAETGPRRVRLRPPDPGRRRFER